MVDHDSRRRVAKKFDIFFFIFFKILKILQRFHQASARAARAPPRWYSCTKFSTKFSIFLKRRSVVRHGNRLYRSNQVDFRA